MKTCTACNTSKPLEEFHLDRCKKDGRASSCKACARERAVLWAKTKPHKARENRRRYRTRNRDAVLARGRAQKAAAHAKLRRLVLVAYSGESPSCACCGETHVEFLEIDHINNDGAMHRQTVGSGSTRTLRWLRDNGFPAGFQILCRNCNQAKHVYGVCPHQVAPEPSMTGS